MEREREKEALRVAAGAFPVLGGGPQHAPSAPAAAAAAAAAVGTTAGRRGGVLSVDSRTKRVVVGSYTGFISKRTAVGDGEREEGEEERDEEEEEGSRVPPPPREVEYVRVQRGPATRWVDLKGGAGGGVTAKYVALPVK